MKTYVISLKKAKERSKYIEKHINELELDYEIIPAVDGSLLSREEINNECNTEKVDRLRWWLTNGAIGCALSHKLAYKKFLDTNENSVFIIEDDIVLPVNIKSILEEISKEIKPNEIILLYYTSFKPAQFSKIKGVQLSVNPKQQLYFPMDIKQPITAAAYCIGRDSAKNILKVNTPIEVTADSWHDFYSKNAFESFRVLYPSTLKTKNFKSSIDYLGDNTVKSRLSNFINSYKIPILYQFVRHIRKKRLNSMLHHFSLTNIESPLSKNTSTNNVHSK